MVAHGKDEVEHQCAIVCLPCFKNMTRLNHVNTALSLLFMVWCNNF